ncbi:hypothetical protein LTR78_005060 [Recurvomyces mirabilis]|uniref:MFS general substrate transporter n=1 Tax=Recurvomyces mirabilis TaxID=574656 RepID=A0AAE0WNM7_9PEZI|nr:hypothetical protein LTR78_005060 [Recurvomyces mirabilis]
MEDIELESVEVYHSPPDQPNTKPVIRILLGCGLLQLPIWGFAMTFGIFQDTYAKQHRFNSSTGIIGTTTNGVMYLSMPILSTLLEKEAWVPWQRTIAILGTLLSAISFLGSSWGTTVGELVLLQGVLAALGNAMTYTPTTLWIDTWFRGGNRATAYSVAFSMKNIVGTATPFLMSGLAGIALVPLPPTTRLRRQRNIPWSFLTHRTFYIYSIANIVFSCGYGLPQTYLSIYASQYLHLPAAESAAMIALFNAPGILSCTGFGLLHDKLNVSSTVTTLVSAIGSALSVFLLWGLKSNTIAGLLISFAIGFGFFASAYSSTWGGWINEIEKEAAENNEAVNSGMVYGFMNGARGIGYVAGGLSGVGLLQLGAIQASQQWAFGTKYGALILFTGISSAFGGWSVLWRGLSCRR